MRIVISKMVSLNSFIDWHLSQLVTSASWKTFLDSYTLLVEWQFSVVVEKLPVSLMDVCV